MRRPASSALALLAPLAALLCGSTLGTSCATWSSSDVPAEPEAPEEPSVASSRAGAAAATGAAEEPEAPKAKGTLATELRDLLPHGALAALEFDLKALDGALSKVCRGPSAKAARRAYAALMQAAPLVTGRKPKGVRHGVLWVGSVPGTEDPFVLGGALAWPGLTDASLAEPYAASAYAMRDRPVYELAEGVFVSAAGGYLLFGNARGLWATWAAYEGATPRLMDDAHGEAARVALDQSSGPKRWRGVARGVILPTNMSDRAPDDGAATGRAIRGFEAIGVAIDEALVVTLAGRADIAWTDALEADHAAMRASLDGGAPGPPADGQPDDAEDEGGADPDEPVEPSMTRTAQAVLLTLLDGDARFARDGDTWSARSKGSGKAALPGLVSVALEVAREHLLRGLTQEALDTLDVLAGAVERAFRNSRDTDDGDVRCHFPASSKAPMPATSCCVRAVDRDRDRRCDGNGFAWTGTPPWSELGVSIAKPHRFVYTLETEGEGADAIATITAHGDLDCDGKRSTFQRTILADRAAADGYCRIAEEQAWVIDAELE